MKKRSQIAEKYKWDLTKIFKSEQEAMEAIEYLRSQIPVVESFKGKLKDKQKYIELYKLENELSLIFSKVGNYGFLKHSENLEDQSVVEFNSIVSNLGMDFSLATAYIEPEMATFSDEYINELMSEPELKNDRLALLELIRTRPHILSELEETILSKTGRFSGEFSEIFDNIDSIDIKFEKVKDKNGKLKELNNSNFVLYLENKDRTLRENSFKSLYNGFIGLSNTIATNYIASVKSDYFYADMYKHKSTLEATLFGGNIDSKIYYNLIENVNNNVGLLHKYFALKKKILGYKTLEYWDTYVSVASINKKFTFEQGMEVLYKALAPMGTEYVELLRRSVSERWIDVYPNEGKATGAFCDHIYGITPFVLLNTVDNVDSVFTTAHELGHAMHSYYSNTNQPYELSNYPIILAEIASITNEILLLKYFYNNSKSKQEKIYYLDKYLKMFKSTLYRQTMFSEFEDYAHKLVEQNQPISKDILRKYYGELNKKYHGKALKHSPLIEYEWLRIPHFYNSYYVYKYSTSMVCSIFIAAKILSGDESAKENYFNFLKSGGSDYATNILEKCGFNLKENDIYSVAFDEMKWALKELEKLVK